MQWTDVKTEWKDLQGKFKSKWTMLTDADLKMIDGKRDELVRLLKKHYKSEEAKIDQQVDEFVKTLKKMHV